MKTKYTKSNIDVKIIIALLIITIFSIFTNNVYAQAQELEKGYVEYSIENEDKTDGFEADLKPQQNNRNNLDAFGIGKTEVTTQHLYVRKILHSEKTLP